MVPERRNSLQQGPWRVKDQPLKTQTEPQNHKRNTGQSRWKKYMQVSKYVRFV